MKSISTSFLLLLTLFAIAQAPKEKALLWKISRNGIDEPSYLYGTIHLMCPDQIKIDSVLKRSFYATKQLYLEINTSDPEMMTKAMKGMLMDSGESLENLIGKADFDSMSHIFLFYELFGIIKFKKFIKFINLFNIFNNEHLKILNLQSNFFNLFTNPNFLYGLIQ